MHLAVEEHGALEQLDLAERLDLDAVPVDRDRPRELATPEAPAGAADWRWSIFLHGFPVAADGIGLNDAIDGFLGLGD